MRKFSADQYYLTEKNLLYPSKGLPLIVRPLEAGLRLIAQYYKVKYGSNIDLISRLFCLKNKNDLGITSRSPSGKGSPFEDVLEKFKTDLETIRRNVQHLQSYRHAFLFGADEGHATPVIYVKENEKEAILVADSIGLSPNNIQKNITLKRLSEILPIYSVEAVRQADMISCYTDAIIFCRDCTRKNKEDDYYIGNLLEKLELRSEQSDLTVKSVKLPRELLKTAQIPQFILEHEEVSASQQVIHKQKTLSTFRDEYSIENPNRKKINIYLSKKSEKYTDVIEIQFYISEIERVTSSELKAETRAEFIKEAKCILKEKEIQRKKNGLWSLAEKFLLCAIVEKLDEKILFHAVKNALNHYISSHGKIGFGLWRNFFSDGLNQARQWKDELVNESLKKKT